MVFMLEIFHFDRKCQIFAAVSAVFLRRQARPVNYLRNSSSSCSLVFCLLCSLPNPEKCGPPPAPEGLLLTHNKVQAMS